MHFLLQVYSSNRSKKPRDISGLGAKSDDLPFFVVAGSSSRQDMKEKSVLGTRLSDLQLFLLPVSSRLYIIVGTETRT